MGNVAAIQEALSKATRSSSIEAKQRELRNPSWEEENLKREREALRQGRGVKCKEKCACGGVRWRRYQT